MDEIEKVTEVVEEAVPAMEKIPSKGTTAIVVGALMLGGAVVFKCGECLYNKFLKDRIHIGKKSKETEYEIETEI